MSNPKLIQNRYQLIEKLGQGGMGIVYKAIDRLTGESVALKQLRVSAGELDFASKAGTDDTEKLRLSLVREFRILATLRHPHILSVLDFGFDNEGDHPYYTMTLLEGGQDVRTYATPISTRERIVLMGQMLQALHYLHRRGVLHRDLKPDNVFVTQDRQIKVMDFGLAKLEETHSLQDSDRFAGTIHYLAPELFEGASASVASDLFAVGVTVYEIMVGQHPFAASTIGDTILNILTHNPDMASIPPVFVPWLETLLDKDPSRRYPTAYATLMAFYDVVGIEAPPEDRSIRESFLQASTFVGRKAELKQLTDALDTLEIENSFFLIGGESGVGKSRLLDELQIRAQVKGVTVLRGQAVEGAGLPFQLWQNILRPLLLMVDVTDFQASVLKEIVADISQLLRREVPDALKLIGKSHQERIILTIVDGLRAAEQPILLVLEDLHWAVESLEPLKQILLVSEQFSELMIVASHRDDEAPNLPDTLAGMTPIKLKRLTEPMVAELSAAMLGEVGTDEDVIRLLHRESEGNVFFVVETVRALAENSGGLQRISRSTLTDGILTGGMRQVLLRRLNAVDPRFREVQKFAAIVGRTIDMKLMANVYGVELVSNWLLDAAEHAVVDMQDNRWRFANDKLRETLLSTVADDEKPSLHRTVAITIEAVYANDTAYNETLMLHWREAGNLDKELLYLDPIAKQMVEIQGGFEAAQSLLENALERLPDEDPRCLTFWNYLAELHQKRGDYATSRVYLEQVQAAAALVGDETALVNSLRVLGAITTNQGAFEEATELFQRGLAIVQSLGDQYGIARFLNYLGILAVYQGAYERATERFQESLTIFQQIGNQHGIGSSLGDLGAVASNQGAYERAIPLLEESLSILRPLGDQQGIGRSLVNLGSIAVRQGAYERATQLYQESLAIAERLGYQSGISVALSNLGWIKVKQQADVDAVAPLVRGLQISNRLQASWLSLYFVVSFAGVLLQRRHAQRAGELLALVEAHPLKSPLLQERIDELMLQLQAAALERGKDLDLDTVVAELLAEFRDAEPDNKRAASTTQPITENATPSLDAVLVAALAQVNTASPDETIISVEAARQKLSAAQAAELEAKLQTIEASATGEDTIELGDIINAVVTMLRDANDT